MGLGGSTTLDAAEKIINLCVTLEKRPFRAAEVVPSYAGL